jgi:aminoglycoside phosphotransferase (APT) family kinase protein
MEPADVVALIAEQFPALRPVNAKYLGEGYDSVAFDVAPHWVFRFPKRRDVEEQVLLELRVLPLLMKSAPLPIPDYRFCGLPSKRFPRHFAGYRKLPGRPAIGSDALVATESIARDLGRFLSWLHAFPVALVEPLGIPRIDGTSVIDELRDEALVGFEALRGVAVDQPLTAWHRALDQAPGASRSAGVLLHADLAAEHVLWAPEEERLSGVIDWSEIGIGDPAIDLAATYHWGGPAFADRVFAHYVPVIDERTVERARYLAICRGVADIVFGIETGRTEYIAAGNRALVLNVGGKEP